MRRRELLRAVGASMPTCLLRPWILGACADAAGQDGNAAEIYYERGFTWVQGLKPDQRECLFKAATVPLDDLRVDRLIEQAGPALEALREAAAVGHCRWTVETITIDDLNQGHLNGGNRHLVHVACLAARRHARSGRGREALDDLFAGLTLAHRLGINGILIARLFEAASEMVAFETLGRILPVLDAESRGDLSRRLDALPPPEPASATIGPESRFILGTFRANLLKLGMTIKDSDWAELGYEENQPESGALKRLCGGDRARLLAHLDDTRPIFDELARRLDLPRPRCRAALDEFVEAERSTHPIVTGFVPAAWNNWITVERQRLLRVMVRAGLALVASGESAFRTIADPSRPGPFELERRGTGHLVRSAKHDDGMPEVTLAIGE
jgi:hypothetical protein